MTQNRTRNTAFIVLLTFLIVSPSFVHAEQMVEGDEPPHAGLALIPMVEDLMAGDLETRIAAAMALRELGAIAEPAVPELIEALSDASVGVRKSAAGALGGIGEGAASAVPALAALLEDPHRFVRSWAAMALYEIGSASQPAADHLIRLMKTDTENLRGRSWAASALPVIGADPETAVPALIAALAEDDSEEVRAVAALSIERFGIEARHLGATDALIDALGDRAALVRGNAACVLSKWGPEALRGRSALALGLRDEAPRVRGCAAAALGEIGGSALEWIDEIESLRRDEHAHVRHRAKEAYERLESFKTSSEAASH